MKVIKHLKHDTPEHKIKTFFKQMPFITKLNLVLVTIVSLICFISIVIFSIELILRSNRILNQLLLFLIVGITDCQNQQRRGSIFYILSYFSKILILGIFNRGVSILLEIATVPGQFFTSTSYPILFCLILAYRDMLAKPSQLRYFLIAPFQIKYLFYPIFLIALLLIFGLRVDIISAFLVSILITVSKVDKVLVGMSKALDKKILNERWISIGMLPTGVSEVEMGQIDRITTNNSVVLDQN